MLETDLSIIDCGDNTFKIQLNNVEILNVDVQYSFDNSTWFDYSYQSPIGVGETTTVYARAKDVNDDVYITKNKTIKYYYMRPAPPSISSYNIKFESGAGVHVGEHYYTYTVDANCSLNGPDKNLDIKAEYYSSKEKKWISFPFGRYYDPSDYSSYGDDGEARFRIEEELKNDITEIRAYTVGDRDKYRYIYSIATSQSFSYGSSIGSGYTDLICDFNSNINFLKCDDNNLRFYIGSPSTHDTCSVGLCGNDVHYKIEYAATDSLVGNYSYNYLPNEIELEANFTLVPYNNTNVYYTATLNGAYRDLYPGYDYYIQLDDEIYGPYHYTISVKGEPGCLGNPYLKYKDEEDNGLPFFLYCDSGSVNMELYSLNNNSTLKIHKVNTEFLIGSKSIDYDQTLDYSYFINYLKKLNKKYIIFYLSARCECGYYYNKGNHIVITTDKDYARAKKANGKYHPCAPYVVKDGNWTQCALNSAVLSKLKDDTGEYILDSNEENIYTLEDSSVISNS